MKKQIFSFLLPFLFFISCVDKSNFKDADYLSSAGIWETKTNSLEKMRVTIEKTGKITIENVAERSYSFKAVEIFKQHTINPYNNKDTLDSFFLRGTNDKDGFSFDINISRDSIFLNMKQIKDFYVDSIYLTVLTRKK